MPVDMTPTGNWFAWGALGAAILNMAVFFLLAINRAHREVDSAFPCVKILLVAVGLLVLGLSITLAALDQGLVSNHEGDVAADSWLLVGVALVIILFFLSLAFYYAKQEGDPSGIVSRVLLPFLLAYLLLFGLVLFQAVSWSEAFLSHANGSPKQGEDGFIKMVYQSRSMVAGAQTILLAACALFVPFLINMWNESAKHLVEQVVKYSELAERCKVPHSKMNQYNQDMAKIKNARAIMAKLRDDLRLPFGIVIVLVFVSAGVSTVSYLVASHCWAYMLPVLLASFNSMLFIAFLIFTVIQMILVQRRVGSLDHSEFLQ